MGSFARLAGYGLVGQGCSFVTQVFLAGQLGPTGYGAVAFALAVQGYATLLGTPAARAVLVRELVLRPEARGRLLGAQLALNGGASVVAAVVIGLAVGGVAALPGEGYLVGAALLGAVLSGLIPLAAFDADGRQGESLRAVAVAEASGTAAVLYLWSDGCLTLGSTAVVLGGKWGVSLVAHWLLLGPGGIGELAFCTRTAGRLARASLPLAGAGLVGAIPLSVGVPVVRILGGSEAAAYLGLGVSAASALLLLAGYPMRLIQPALAASAAGRRPYGRLGRYYAGYVAVTWAGGLGAAVALTELVPAYRPARPVIAIMLTGAAASAWGLPLAAWLVTRSRGGAVLMAHVVGAVAYSAGTLALSPGITPAGSSVLTAGSLLLVTAVLWVSTRSARAAAE